MKVEYIFGVLRLASLLMDQYLLSHEAYRTGDLHPHCRCGRKAFGVA